MQGGPPPCTPRRSAGGRPIGQEISKIRGGNMKQNPLKSRGLWGVREWNRKKMYPSGWKHYAWVKKTLRRTFVSLWKNCFSPFGRKNNHFFLGKQKFASEFFCPWHKVSTQKEHIFLSFPSYSCLAWIARTWLDCKNKGPSGFIWVTFQLLV